MNCEVIAVAAVSNALVIGGIAFLAKGLVNNLLKKDIGKFQDELSRKASREIESFKSELEIERVRLQISYGGIFEKQAEAILDLYKSVLDIEDAATNVIHSAVPAAQKREGFAEIFSEVRDKYLRNRILLSEDIDNDISDFVDKIFSSVFKYTSADDRLMQRMNDEQLQKFFDKQEEAAKIVIMEIPKIRDKLVNRMRYTLGVNPHSSSKQP